MVDERIVVEWVADFDPSLHWQVARDVLGAAESAWGPTGAMVEAEGVCARLLSLEDADGQWSGGSFVPPGFDGRRFREEGQPWTTTWVLTQLPEVGLDPTSARARETVRLVGENSRWDNDAQPYWSGEVDECING